MVVQLHTAAKPEMCMLEFRRERERERESIHNLEITIAAAKLYYVFTSSTHSKRTTAKKFG